MGLFGLSRVAEAARAMRHWRAHKRRSVEGLADQFIMLNRAKLPPEELEQAKMAMRSVMRMLEGEEG